eukprot:TRINITY_DN1846_c0_g1_i2.p1 TRINITY_DN1846_c0_g1~~TRINITY_DN1846_c0_g1_i2.p1  ORF type:complete len:242 (+),score=83.53 TRINITY_DN1846_c0_g1_i2:337-1062(+)
MMQSGCQHVCVLAAVALLLAVLCVDGAAAHKRYESRIPNGKLVHLDGKSCKASGHATCSGKGHEGKKLNQFGYDFKKAGKKWTHALCMMDSDGDGLTNGEELGDPCCVWKEGHHPARSTHLSHPSHASDVNSAHGCDGEHVEEKIVKNARTKGEGDGTILGMPLWLFVSLCVAVPVLALVVLVMVGTVLLRIRSRRRAGRKGGRVSVPLSVNGQELEEGEGATEMELLGDADRLAMEEGDE